MSWQGSDTNQTPRSRSSTPRRNKPSFRNGKKKSNNIFKKQKDKDASPQKSEGMLGDDLPKKRG